RWLGNAAYRLPAICRAGTYRRSTNAGYIARHRLYGINTRTQPVSFITAKKEKFLPDYRPAKRSAKLI
ncbi:hypothetical protein OFM36_37270, partial [Escherichia coli]|nr:hypothetical protein [Escherichia coli]